MRMFVSSVLVQRASTSIIDGFDGAGTVLTDRIEPDSLPTKFGTRYRERIQASTNVTAVLHARCLGQRKRRCDEGIDEVEFVDRAGHHRHLMLASIRTGNWWI